MAVAWLCMAAIWLCMPTVCLCKTTVWLCKATVYLCMPLIHLIKAFFKMNKRFAKTTEWFAKTAGKLFCAAKGGFYAALPPVKVRFLLPQEWSACVRGICGRIWRRCGRQFGGFGDTQSAALQKPPKNDAQKTAHAEKFALCGKIRLNVGNHPQFFHYRPY